ncbi:MAG: 3'-5' exonuclease [Candidatus Eisenbacteria bacterium]
MLPAGTIQTLDTETTGMSPAQGHVVVEVARVALVDGVIGETWSTLVKPGRAIPPDASAVHGITDTMVADAPAPGDAGRALSAGCGGAPLVLHNATFDMPFLHAMMRGAGIVPLWNPVIDTLGLARGLFGTGNNSLGALAARHALPREAAHRALGDALTTARLFLLLAERWEREKGVTSLAELAAVSQDVVRLTGRR